MRRDVASIGLDARYGHLGHVIGDRSNSALASSQWSGPLKAGKHPLLWAVRRIVLALLVAANAA
jgi:hypothetical protein